MDELRVAGNQTKETKAWSCYERPARLRFEALISVDQTTACFGQDLSKAITHQKKT